jgi:hypothetical protein
VPYTTRLSIFYLFNDLAQYAARDKRYDYLEHGSSIFLAVVTQYVQKFSSKERSPFIRTLSVWGERHVFSRGFLDKLRTHWESTAHVDAVPEPMKPSPAKISQPAQPNVSKLSYRGDPKMFDLQEVLKRLDMQAAVSASILSELNSTLINIGGDVPSTTGSSNKVPEYDPILALKACLAAEMNVCSH